VEGDGGIGEEREGRSGYMRPTATSSTLSLNAKSEKPSQTPFAVFVALWPASRRASSASSRRGMVVVLRW